MYKGKPNINIDILEKINLLVDIPLVLHGGSGTPEETIKKCIDRGIAKVNFNTEISVNVMENIKCLFNDEKIFHFSTLSMKNKEVVKGVVKKYIELFS